MSFKIAIGAIALLACVGIAFAATNVGRVSGNAYDYSDEGATTCCPKIKYPSGAATELNRACEKKGGRYFQNEKFVNASYCETFRNPDSGWKYKCRKAVEADCMR